MGRVIVVLAAIALALGSGTPLPGQVRVRDVDDGGHFPAGWSVWTLRPGEGFPDPRTHIKFIPVGNGYQLTVGNQTTALLYRPADQVNGPFRFEVKFSKAERPFDYPEGYGLFFGGKHLASDSAGDADPEYIYFLVRSIGQYMIRRRKGGEIVDLKPWTPYAAIQQTDTSGHSANVLAIEGQWNSSKVVFRINGQAVDSIAVAADDLKGIVGIRAVWDQDLYIGGYAVQSK